jgi:hypothetical protein
MRVRHPGQRFSGFKEQTIRRLRKGQMLSALASGWFFLTKNTAYQIFFGAAFFFT